MATRWWLGLVLGGLAGGVTGCPPKRAITVRACAVDGVDNARTIASDATERASKIWWQADIGFIPLPDIPIIPDPQPPKTHLDVPPYAAPGVLGDIRLDDDRGYGSEENEALITECLEAWRQRGYSGEPQPGMTVVFVHELLTTVGGYSSESGISSDLSEVFRRNGTLCQPPYVIAGSDVAGRWSVIETYNYRQAVSLERIAVTLAHELGHDLLLGHGDGLDNDGNGYWDDYCDTEATVIPLGANSDAKPLMDPTVDDGYFISPLQAARAGAAADALIAAGLAN